MKPSNKSQNQQWVNYRPNRLKKTLWENCTFIYSVNSSTSTSSTKQIQKPAPITRKPRVNNVRVKNIDTIPNVNRMQISYLLN